MTSPTSSLLLFFITPETLYLHPLHPPLSTTTTTTTDDTPSLLPNHTLNNNREADGLGSSEAGEDGEGGGGGGGGGEGWGAEEGGKVGYLCVLSVVVVAGNLLVVASIVLLRSMHRVANYFLLSLASADLMVGVVTIPLFILWLTNPEVFRRGLSCHLVLLSCLFVMAASQLNVVAVTLERYVAVCHPFYHRSVLLSKPRVVTLTVAGVWLASLVSAALSSLAIDTDSRECRYYRYFNRSFLLVVVLVGVFLPFALILALNLRMLVKIRSSRVFTQEMYRPTQQQQQRRRRSSSSSSSQQRQRRSSSVGGGMSKATSMVMTVCCLYLLAWTPFFIVILVHSFCGSCQLRGALDLILLFAFTNSAWNPLLYALCNLKFRKAYAQILTLCCCPLPPSTTTTTTTTARRDSVFLLFQPGRRCADKRSIAEA